MSNIYYSDNGDEYRHDDIEEAIESVLSYREDLRVASEFCVWMGECNFNKASYYASSSVVEDMGNHACDELPDFADSWPGVSKAQEDELQSAIDDVIDKWADKYDQQPKFGIMSNCKEMTFVVTKMAEHTSEIEYAEKVSA